MPAVLLFIGSKVVPGKATNERYRSGGGMIVVRIPFDFIAPEKKQHVLLMLRNDRATRFNADLFLWGFPFGSRATRYTVACCAR